MPCAHSTESRSMECGFVEFLPSPYGLGFKATISGWWGHHDPIDGWVNAYDLKGVAQLPSADDFSSPAWLRTVLKRLRENGVIFLTATQAADYLEAEAPYWRARRMNKILAGRRILRAFRKPSTPIGERARIVGEAIATTRDHFRPDPRFQ